MTRFLVATDLVISTHIKIEVEADNKDDAVDRASELLPQNFKRDSWKGWKANVALTPPKGVTITECKAYHFQQASGADKAVRKQQ